MAKLIDITGKIFGRLTVLRRSKGAATRDAFHNARWECRCRCGNICQVASSSLRSGETRSCGCFQNEVRKLKLRKHGMTKTPEHNTWLRIIQRCHNPNDNSYWLYGARGIHVCNEWRENFMVFFSDMGKRPSAEYSLDRIDNEKGYCKENCRWATQHEQSRNRRDTFLIECNGEKLCMVDWAARLGVDRSTIYARIRRGMTPTSAILDILNQPIRLTGGPKIGSGLVITVGDKTLTVAQWCEELGRTKAAIYTRIRRGQTPEFVIEDIIKINTRKAKLHGHRYTGK